MASSGLVVKWLVLSRSGENFAVAMDKESSIEEDIGGINEDPKSSKFESEGETIVDSEAEGDSI